jgi:predicted Zn-dependent protease
VVGQDPAEGVFHGERFLHPDLGLTLRFPEGWTTQNSRKAVVAVPPRRDAMVLLELQQLGTDTRAAASAYLESQGLPALESDAFRVAGLPALRVLSSTREGNTPTALDFTWIAHEGRIYRITAATSSERYPAYDSAFAATARSFRTLREEEVAEIEVFRLRVAQAQAGETLYDLSQRTGNGWSALETAVANGIPAEARFEGGEWLKIARVETYRGVRDLPTPER